MISMNDEFMWCYDMTIIDLLTENINGKSVLHKQSMWTASISAGIISTLTLIAVHATDHA